MLESKYIHLSCIDDLFVLKTHLVYADEYANADKALQAKIYAYCTLHSGDETCRKNVNIIREAITRLYFAM